MARAPCEEYRETVGSIRRAGVVQLLQIQIQQTVPLRWKCGVVGYHSQF